MRYNPDTERGLNIEAQVEENRRIISKLPAPHQLAKVWHAGQWISNPLFTPLPV